MNRLQSEYCTAYNNQLSLLLPSNLGSLVFLFLPMPSLPTSTQAVIFICCVSYFPSSYMSFFFLCLLITFLSPFPLQFFLFLLLCYLFFLSILPFIFAVNVLRYLLLWTIGCCAGPFSYTKVRNQYLDDLGHQFWSRKRNGCCA